MSKDSNKELIILKTTLWIYIIFCFVIAGLNYGYVKTAPESIAKTIAWVWHFYENWIKTVFIVLASILTIRIIKKSKRTQMRKRNLIGFIIAALIVHIVSPWVLNNNELYFFTMPLPWTTTPLQLLVEDSSFYASRFPLWGATGITASLIFYLLYSCIVLIGTVFFGRRWQCSTICLFNGFASEVFAPAFPLIGKKKRVQPKTLRILTIIKWIFFSLALFFTVYWVLLLFGVPVFGDYNLISKLEIYKYLCAELLMMMSFWIVFIGRGYCYYCPLGTLLGLIGKLVGQKIITNHTKCISCNQCNLACPMTIDIKSKALNGQPVTSLRCVGCGHCVDACTTETLSYTTIFLNRLSKKKSDALEKGEKKFDQV
ncbi:MAG TPA: 4Fe-4S dicluster domain-containing protein [Oscillospiraceae bacterium]|nr:4Fe-4S dicluster domain-containing protein [Oscillospiraceae bacterium]HRW57727.1 4Fe-4S dicluster domain-containing protein [Oscillospiraceae bacterium]